MQTTTINPSTKTITSSIKNETGNTSGAGTETATTTYTSGQFLYATTTTTQPEIIKILSNPEQGQGSQGSQDSNAAIVGGAVGGGAVAAAILAAATLALRRWRTNRAAQQSAGDLEAQVARPAGAVTVREAQVARRPAPAATDAEAQVLGRQETTSDNEFSL